MKVHKRVHMTMAGARVTMNVRAGGDGAPHSQACVICWTWPAPEICWTVTHVICWKLVGDWFAVTVTQVQGVCLSELVGGLWRPDAGLVEMKSGGFVDDVDRMGK